MTNETKQGRKPIRELTPEAIIPDMEAAESELEREANLRSKCFDRWVQEGRLTYVDARDRQGRLLMAWRIIRDLRRYLEGEGTPEYWPSRDVSLPD